MCFMHQKKIPKIQVKNCYVLMLSYDVRYGQSSGTRNRPKIEGKTPRNACHCDSAQIRFVGKSVIIRAFS